MALQQVTAVTECSRSPAYGSAKVNRGMEYYLSISPLKRLEGVESTADIGPLIAYVKQCGEVGWSQKTSLEVFTRWTECRMVSEHGSESSDVTSESRSSRRRRVRRAKVAQGDAARDVKAAEPGFSYVKLFGQRSALGVADALGPNPTLVNILSRAAEEFAPGVLAGAVGYVRNIGRYTWAMDEPGDGAVAVADVAVALNCLLAGSVSATVAKRLYARAKPDVQVFVGDRVKELPYSLPVLRDAQMDGLCYLKGFPVDKRVAAFVALGTYPTVDAVVAFGGCDVSMQVVKVDEGLWHTVDDRGDSTVASLHSEGCGDERVGAFVACGNLGIGHLLAGRCGICKTHDPAKSGGTVVCHGDGCLAERQASRGMSGVPASVFVRADGAELAMRGDDSCAPLSRGWHGCELKDGKVFVAAHVSKVEIPAGYTVEVLGTDVTVVADSGPIHLIAFEQLAIKVSDEKGIPAGCLAVYVGGYDEKVRWLHRQLGEDPTETFSRFWTRIGAPVAVGVIASATESDGGGLIVDGPEMMDHDAVAGVTFCHLGMGAHKGCWGGTAVAANGGAVRLEFEVTRSLDGKGGGRMTVSLAGHGKVALARRVSGFKVVGVSADELPVAYHAEGDYELDDGGPSDSEGFFGEF